MYGIVLTGPKHWENVGGVLRLSHNYEANFVVVCGMRYKKHCSDTTSNYRHIPVFHHVDDPHKFIPYDCVPVAVEIVDEAKSLYDFYHPKNAVYFFGPEDGSVPKKFLNYCKFKVYIPTVHCMNLASTVACVLYDRKRKQEV
jgi:tRNA(Leu) C34 or U34 (ribose-2'-O)-methylase TrmL